ncbi:MAG: hypothetical protein QNJ97_29010 [Myxococcota bacterium]|nr:hypothetical protein [Myxococcota bacterium]
MISYLGLNGQSEIIELPDLSVIGVLFSDNYEPNFNLENSSSRYTPSKQDIIKAESLLRIFDVKRRKSRGQLYRQYLGFFEGDTRFILVHAISGRSQKKVQKNFPNWKTSFELLFVDPDASQKSFLYKINLDQGLIGFF